ncbi:MAG: helix-turn-helix domain-containing protein [Chloroflexia bacterium]
MSALDLLQQLGLTKYEAEAYHALLIAGPLTGYELGKHSGVPQSRCYDTLERLLARGLATVQPTIPPRYAAEDPARFLARTRAERDATLGALADALADLAPRREDDQFWVLRGRRAILDRAASLIAEAEQSIQISCPADLPELAAALHAVRSRGVLVTVRAERGICLLADDHLALVGTLAPLESCQATVSGNPALVATVRASFAPEASARPALRAVPPLPQDAHDQRLAWLAWEERKQRRLIGGQ